MCALQHRIAEGICQDFDEIIHGREVQKQSKGNQVSTRTFCACRIAVILNKAKHTSILSASEFLRQAHPAFPESPCVALILIKMEFNNAQSAI